MRYRRRPRACGTSYALDAAIWMMDIHRVSLKSDISGSRLRLNLNFELSESQPGLIPKLSIYISRLVCRDGPKTILVAESILVHWSDHVGDMTVLDGFLANGTNLFDVDLSEEGHRLTE
jgi:hypothetical protein